ncbi:hypothetical protein [Negativibacillus massiliensis]|uniref:hypothetical protein n=1 Tax=Negativibacillus massiliensis TaxID=1871035 RepID=UPI003AF2584F
MKKIIFAVMLSAALVTFGGISAIAAPSSCMKGCNRINFVDTNGDGICDNHGTNCSIGFVDENGDGICDHRTSANTTTKQNGMGRRGCHNNMNGHGCHQAK